MSGFSCGRRNDMAMWAQWPSVEEQILAWMTIPEGPDSWRPNGTCSYCGSISGEEFMRLVEAGQYVSPTDKSYKAYIEDPSGRLGGGRESKFYFNHLTDPAQRLRFADLYVEHKINLRYPGHFYTRPLVWALINHDKAVTA